MDEKERKDKISRIEKELGEMENGRKREKG